MTSTAKGPRASCPYCPARLTGARQAEEHVASRHADDLPPGYSPARAVYDRNRRPGPRPACVVCSGDVPFVEASRRYRRVCQQPACVQSFREEFVRRMMRVHGKEHLLADPEQQRAMLRGRRISGSYAWRDGTRTPYVGNLERAFLEFLDVGLGWDPGDVSDPPAYTYRDASGQERQYLPDFLIGSLGVVVEVKTAPGTNAHEYRSREAELEPAKRDAVVRTGLIFVRCYDEDYTEFLAAVSLARAGGGAR